MELKIINEKDNALFGRKEIEAVTTSNVTPSRADVLSALAKKFSVDEEHVKIKGIHGKFGTRTFDITANVYTSPEHRHIEIKKKKEAEAAKKMAEAAASQGAE